jgi:hypothetical protein
MAFLMENKAEESMSIFLVDILRAQAPQSA